MDIIDNGDTDENCMLEELEVIKETFEELEESPKTTKIEDSKDKQVTVQKQPSDKKVRIKVTPNEKSTNNSANSAKRSSQYSRARSGSVPSFKFYQTVQSVAKNSSSANRRGSIGVSSSSFKPLLLSNSKNKSQSKSDRDQINNESDSDIEQKIDLKEISDNNLPLGTILKPNSSKKIILSGYSPKQLEDFLDFIDQNALVEFEDDWRMLSTPSSGAIWINLKNGQIRQYPPNYVLKQKLTEFENCKNENKSKDDKIKGLIYEQNSLLEQLKICQRKVSTIAQPSEAQIQQERIILELAKSRDDVKSKSSLIVSLQNELRIQESKINVMQMKMLEATQFLEERKDLDDCIDALKFDNRSITTQLSKYEQTNQELETKLQTAKKSMDEMRLQVDDLKYRIFCEIEKNTVLDNDRNELKRAQKQIHSDAEHINRLKNDKDELATLLNVARRSNLAQADKVQELEKNREELANMKSKLNLVEQENTTLRLMLNSVRLVNGSASEPSRSSVTFDSEMLNKKRVSNRPQQPKIKLKCEPTKPTLSVHQLNGDRAKSMISNDCESRRKQLINSIVSNTELSNLSKSLVNSELDQLASEMIHVGDKIIILKVNTDVDGDRKNETPIEVSGTIRIIRGNQKKNIIIGVKLNNSENYSLSQTEKDQLCYIQLSSISKIYDKKTQGYVNFGTFVAKNLKPVSF